MLVATLMDQHPSTTTVFEKTLNKTMEDESIPQAERSGRDCLLILPPFLLTFLGILPLPLFFYYYFYFSLLYVLFSHFFLLAVSILLTLFFWLIFQAFFLGSTPSESATWWENVGGGWLSTIVESIFHFYPPPPHHIATAQSSLKDSISLFKVFGNKNNRIWYVLILSEDSMQIIWILISNPFTPSLFVEISFVLPPPPPQVLDCVSPKCVNWGKVATSKLTQVCPTPRKLLVYTYIFIEIF